VCTLGLADEPAPILAKELIWKEARIVASRVTHGEFQEAIKHLESGNLKPNVLITRTAHASEVQQAFEELEANPERCLKTVVRLA
jgi:threonine dehydrogenase-like Zn-dependent dehydrogenase